MKRTALTTTTTTTALSNLLCLWLLGCFLPTPIHCALSFASSADGSSMYATTVIQPSNNPALSNNQSSLTYAEGSFDSAVFWQPLGMSSVIDGTYIHLIADSQNRAIRAMDWGQPLYGRTWKVAGSILDGSSSSLDGVCLNQSCPASNPTSGFVMPHAVRIHPYGKAAFVADPRDGYIKIVNLFTSSITSIIAAPGQTEDELQSVYAAAGTYVSPMYPVDLCFIGVDKLAVLDAHNHTVWTWTSAQGYSVSVEASVGAGNWSILSGKNSMDQGSGYVEGSASNARFNQPMGLACAFVGSNASTQLEEFYVADTGNRVIRAVNPSTGFTTLKVGNTAYSPTVVVSDNNNPLLAVLAGPTQLALYQNAVYFTDRNPQDPKQGAVRVWYRQTGYVRTLVGQTIRGSADGLVATGMAAVQAAWGLVVFEVDKVGWSEADTSAIRYVSPTENASSVNRRKMCGVGYYWNDAMSNCSLCSNSSKPEGTIFTGVNCAWACPDPPYVRAFGGCLDFSNQQPVVNGRLATSPGGTLVKVCDAGYWWNGTFCVVCQAGMYCNGMNAMGIGKEVCPTNLTSADGAQSLEKDCYCPLGYFWLNFNLSINANLSSLQNASGSNSGQNCVQCWEGYYCPSDGWRSSLSPVACNGNATSLPGSVLPTNCTCKEGFYGPNGGPCAPCPMFGYCPGGTNYSACPPFTSMANDSVCKPLPGYYGEWSHPAILCPMGFYCPGVLQQAIACPDNATTIGMGSTSLSSCVCAAGFYGSIANATASSGAGAQSSNSNMSGVCKVCPVDKYCPRNSTQVVACPAQSSTQGRQGIFLLCFFIQLFTKHTVHKSHDATNMNGR